MPTLTGVDDREPGRRGRLVVQVRLDHFVRREIQELVQRLRRVGETLLHGLEPTEQGLGGFVLAVDAQRAFRVAAGVGDDAGGLFRQRMDGAGLLDLVPDRPAG